MADSRVRIEATMDVRELRALARKLEARGKSLPLRRIGVIGLRSILRNFDVGGRPTRWAKLAPATLKKRAKGRGQGRPSGLPLMDTGTMRNSMGVQIIGRDNVKVGTDLQMDGAPYPVYQQHGTRTIPARPFALWQDQDVRDVMKLLADHMTGGKV